MRRIVAEMAALATSLTRVDRAHGRLLARGGQSCCVSGSGSPSSAHASVRDEDGICAHHDRYVSARAWGADFSPRARATLPESRDAACSVHRHRTRTKRGRAPVEGQNPRVVRWCGRRDSNPHPLTGSRFSCHFGFRRRPRGRSWSGLSLRPSSMAVGAARLVSTPSPARAWLGIGLGRPFSFPRL